jgi:C4-dicarboxylate-specific signal transduction histidine kinase
MTDAKGTLLREKGFAFFGAITASLSHEINNVLATINELAGLMEDFFAAADGGGELDTERLKNATGRIAAQVERGQTYVKRLNRFAHTVDNSRAVIDVHQMVDAMATLCRRLCTLRRVELQTTLPEVAIELEGCLFDLQHVLFCCIDIVLSAAQQGDTLRIDVEPAGDGARIQIGGEAGCTDPGALTAKAEFVAVLADELGGNLTSCLETDQPVMLALSLPRTMGPAQ